jgi:hypothetical protein
MGMGVPEESGFRGWTSGQAPGLIPLNEPWAPDSSACEVNIRLAQPHSNQDDPTIQKDLKP